MSAVQRATVPVCFLDVTLHLLQLSVVLVELAALIPVRHVSYQSLRHKACATKVHE